MVWKIGGGRWLRSVVTRRVASKPSPQRVVKVQSRIVRHSPVQRRVAYRHPSGYQRPVGFYKDRHGKTRPITRPLPRTVTYIPQPAPSRFTPSPYRHTRAVLVKPQKQPVQQVASSSKPLQPPMVTSNVKDKLVSWYGESEVENFTYAYSPEKAPDIALYNLDDPSSRKRYIALDDAYYVHSMTDVISEEMQKVTGKPVDKNALYQTLLAEYVQKTSSERQSNRMRGESLWHGATPTMEKWNKMSDEYDKSYSYFEGRVEDNISDKGVADKTELLKEYAEISRYDKWEDDIHGEASRSALDKIASQERFKVDGKFIKPSRPRQPITNTKPLTQLEDQGFIGSGGMYHDEQSFTVTPTGRLQIRQMNSSHVSLIVGEFDVKGSGLPEGKWTMLGGSGDKIALKHPSSVEYDPTFKRLIFMKGSDKGRLYKYEVNLDHAKSDDEAPIPRLTLTSGMRLKGRELKELLKKGKDEGETVIISAHRGEIGKRDQVEIQMVRSDYESGDKKLISSLSKHGNETEHQGDPAIATYDPQRLSDFAKHLSDDADISLRFANTMPLKASVKEGATEYDYYLAPKISDDESHKRYLESLRRAMD